MPREAMLTHKTLIAVAAFVLALHGLIHMMGVAAYLHLARLDGLPYKTTVLGGRLDLGERGIAIFGVLWIIPVLGFIACAAALLAGWSFTVPLTGAVTIVSLALTLLDWNVAYAGAAFNLAILCALALRATIPVWLGH